MCNFGMNRNNGCDWIWILIIIILICNCCQGGNNNTCCETNCECCPPKPCC